MKRKDKACYQRLVSGVPTPAVPDRVQGSGAYCRMAKGAAVEMNRFGYMILKTQV